MHVYGYTRVCLGWFWKSQMKEGCAVLRTGDLPQNWPQKKQSGVSIYNAVIIVLFCKFVLAKHDEVITSSAVGFPALLA